VGDAAGAGHQARYRCGASPSLSPKTRRVTENILKNPMFTRGVEMKKTALIVIVVLLAGCTSNTEYGTCIGAFDEKDPKLTYKLSGWNAFMAVLGTSLLFIPTIMVVANNTFCPVAKK
jgi:hypothetical protein